MTGFTDACSSRERLSGRASEAFGDSSPELRLNFGHGEKLHESSDASIRTTHHTVCRGLFMEKTTAIKTRQQTPVDRQACIRRSLPRVAALGVGRPRTHDTVHTTVGLAAHPRHGVRLTHGMRFSCSLSSSLALGMAGTARRLFRPGLIRSAPASFPELVSFWAFVGTSGGRDDGCHVRHGVGARGFSPHRAA